MKVLPPAEHLIKQQPGNMWWVWSVLSLVRMSFVAQPYVSPFPLLKCRASAPPPLPERSQRSNAQWQEEESLPMMESQVYTGVDREGWHTVWVSCSVNCHTPLCLLGLASTKELIAKETHWWGEGLQEANGKYFPLLWTIYSVLFIKVSFLSLQMLAVFDYTADPSRAKRSQNN